MELLQLRYFQMVAKLGSVSQAAKYFNIPQSSMSQTLARLESSLGGVQLFDRRNGRVYLNDEGKVFLEYVDRGLLELDKGYRVITSEKSRKISGNIRIKIMENHRLVMTCIPQFSEVNPDVNFSIIHGYQEDQDITYDMCISASRSYKYMSWSVPLIKENLVLAVHKDNPLAKKSVVSVSDLKDQKLLTLPSQSSLYQTTKEMCKKHGFDPTFFLVCDDPYFVRKYIEEKMGVAVAPEVSWRGRFRENTVLVPIEDSPVLTSYIILDGKKYPSAAVSAFKDYLLDAASKLEGNLVSKDEQMQ